ncbi:hypothetical protein V5799_004724 [Amblyomma americanum]|uniref:Uncharacterized protein n=1 Tax=Amblyomma americanum TaxID=6943 RepID=A0AAQ4D5A4_AMBAM
MLTGSWWKVSPTTIRNCWRKAGLLKTPPHPQDRKYEDNDNASELWEEAQENLSIDPSVTFDDYVECDAAAWTAAELTTEDIVSSVREPEDGSDDDNVEAEIADRPDDCVSSSGVLNAIGKVLHLPWSFYQCVRGGTQESRRHRVNCLAPFVLHKAEKD